MMPKRERPYLGHAVTNKGIRFLSVSQIKQFDTTVDGGCKRKWAYAYRFGIKLARTDALKKGSKEAEILEHYLRTGEDVLSPTLSPTKKFWPTPGADLDLEEPLGNIASAVELRDMLLKGKHPENIVRSLQHDIDKHAGLSFAGIPVDGAADCRHVRGEYVDSDGILKKDPVGAFVVHVDDLKTTSRIYPHKVQSGPHAGQILPTYCKTDAEVCEDVQMIGYLRHAINKYPGMTHGRAGLIYANKTKHEAVKRTGIISVAQILERAHRIDNVVNEMIQIAPVQRIEDVEPNIHACDSYTHVDPQDPTKTLKGCGYRYQCPLSNIQIAATMLGNIKESSMSLCDPVSSVPAVPAPAAQAAPPPPLDSAAHDAAVEEQKKRLLASMGALQVPTAAAQMAYGFCTNCGTALNSANASQLPAGSTLHIGCPKVAVAAAVPTTLVQQAAPPPPPIAVNPLDQPRGAILLDAADPPPVEEIAQITDPTLRAQVEQHAAEHAARAAAQAAQQEAEKVAAGTSSWCPGGSIKMAVTSTMSVEGYTCQCSKHWTIKKLAPEKEGDSYFATIPRHRPKKDEAPIAAPVAEPAPPAPDAYAAQMHARADTQAAPPPPAPAAPITVAPPPPPLAPLAAPQLPSGEMMVLAAAIHTNGHTNGHAQVDNRQAFLIELDSGKKLAVLADTMSKAMKLAEDLVGTTNDMLKSINKLDGLLK